MSEAGEHGRAREHGSASSLHRRERESGAWSRRSLLTRLSAYARASCTGGVKFDAAVRSSATGSRRSLPIPLGRVDLLKLLLLVDPLFPTSLYLGLAGPDGSCVLCSTISMAWRSSSCAVERLCRVRTLLRRPQGRATGQLRGNLVRRRDVLRSFGLLMLSTIGSASLVFRFCLRPGSLSLPLSFAADVSPGWYCSASAAGCSPARRRGRRCLGTGFQWPEHLQRATSTLRPSLRPMSSGLRSCEPAQQTHAPLARPLAMRLSAELYPPLNKGKGRIRSSAGRQVGQHRSTASRWVAPLP